MQQTVPALPGPYVKLRQQRLSELADEHGLPGDTQIAEKLGLDRSGVNRIRTGEARPGERFIAAAIAAFGVPFEELFEIIGAS